MSPQFKSLGTVALTMLLTAMPIFGFSAEARSQLSEIVTRSVTPEGSEEIRLDERFDAKKFDPNRAATILAVESEGGKDGGGGDPSDFQEIIVRSRITKFSKSALVYATVIFTSENQLLGNKPYGFRSSLAWDLSLLDLDLISDSNVRAIFKKMLEQGLLADIRTSPIVPQNNCSVQVGANRKARSATALMNKYSTPICFDPIAFAEASEGVASLSILYGLLVHEYAHHYGYLDLDHKIATEVALAFERKSLVEFQGQDPLDSVANRLVNRMESDADVKSFWENCTLQKNCFSKNQVLRF